MEHELADEEKKRKERILKKKGDQTPPLINQAN